MEGPETGMPTTRDVRRRIDAAVLGTVTAGSAAAAVLFAGTAWATWSTSSTHAFSPAPTPLAASQLPAVQAEQWMAIGSPSTRTVSGHTIAENECAKVAGAGMWTQQGFSGADGENVAVQDTFSFTAPAPARTAYAAFVSAMAGCQATTRALQSAKHIPSNAAVRQTAAAPQALAWERTWTGVMGMSAPGPQTNHIYLAVDGTQLTVLQFTEFAGKAPPYSVSDDPGVLTTLLMSPQTE